MLGIFVYYNRATPKAFTATEKREATQNILGRAIQKEQVQGSAMHDGTYLAFSYPAWVKVDTRDDEQVKKNPNILEFMELRDPDTHLFIVVQVTNADASVMRDDSGITLRKTQTAQYTQDDIILDGHPGLLFTKTGNDAEKTIFLFAQGKLYTIAATALNITRIDAVLPEIVRSIQIK
jgi:hypothetical protein